MSHPPIGSITTPEKTRRSILQRSELIPPLPEFVVRLLAQLNKQDTEPRDIENVLQGDPALVGKMLAMANSPFYGLNRTVRTVRESVMVLGFRGLRSLVLATSTSRFLTHDFGCYGFAGKGLWRHSFAVASAARQLARTCYMDADDSEELFVAGLLHDIGTILLASHLQNRGLEIRDDSCCAEQERKSLGIDHAEAGALIAAKWNLSERVQDIISLHHEGPTHPGLERPLAVVRLANWVAHKSNIGYVPGFSPQSTVLPNDLEALPFTEDGWRQLHPEIEDAMRSALENMESLVR